MIVHVRTQLASMQLRQAQVNKWNPLYRSLKDTPSPEMRTLTSFIQDTIMHGPSYKEECTKLPLK